MNRKGSALLTIILGMSFALCALAAFWRTALYVYELGLERQKYEQEYWQNQGLLLWAVALCKENFVYINQYAHAHPLQITVDQWPPKNWAKVASAGKANIAIAQGGEHSLCITAIGSNQRSWYCELERLSTDQEKPSFALKNWRIH